MPSIRAALVVAVASLCGGLVAAQDGPVTNPLESDPRAVQAGMGAYRQRCGDCHGIDARGVRGPDITQVWASGRSDQGLFQTIRNGVSQSEMPAFTAPRTSDTEIWQMLAYLRTLATPAPAGPPRGDAANGERLFRDLCLACHRVNAEGGRVGPDLSRIGSARSRDVLVLRIRRTQEGPPSDGFAPVALTTSEGRAVRGVTKNEDLFSIQVMESTERIQGFDKASLQALEAAEPIMPAFGPERLTDSELDDIVRYLQTLRGFDPTVR